MHRISTCTALSLTILICACRQQPTPLANTGRSAQEVAASVLEALAAGDRPRLEALALNEAEFRDHVWPDLPAAKPERNLPMAYVWGELHQKSQFRLDAALQEHNGRRYALDRVAFSATTDYTHYTVHRNAVFHVRDAVGAPSEIRVCGSMIQKDGAWKVFSYVVD